MLGHLKTPQSYKYRRKKTHDKERACATYKQDDLFLMNYSLPANSFIKMKINVLMVTKENISTLSFIYLHGLSLGKRVAWIIFPMCAMTSEL